MFISCGVEAPTYSQEPNKRTGVIVCSVVFFTDECDYLRTCFLSLSRKIEPICIGLEKPMAYFCFGFMHHSFNV